MSAMNHENINVEFDRIIKESSVPKALLKDVINAFRGRWAPYPGHEMYTVVKGNTNYLKRIAEPETVEELTQGKKKIPTIENIAEFLASKGIIEFTDEKVPDEFPGEYIDYTEITFCLLTKRDSQNHTFTNSSTPSTTTQTQHFQPPFFDTFPIFC